MANDWLKHAPPDTLTYHGNRCAKERQHRKENIKRSPSADRQKSYRADSIKCWQAGKNFLSPGNRKKVPGEVGKDCDSRTY
ncbi:hypothetical protein DTL42_14575 [Bremerella cremea]|uniref:Uncharacterized protein n=1 Tax=Bremerella cremea TaxID=1031537 RepID=A0A368KQ32_9BACT|nr:hypothetical protein DTL42_14575 [Bremerella cremea]